MPFEQSVSHAPGTSLAITKRIVASLPQSVGAMPAASQAFVAALRSCNTPSAYSHPVATRNAGLVPAWLDWTACRKGKPENESTADQLIADPQYRFDECAKVIERAISVDSVWKNIVRNAGSHHQPEMGVDLVTAPLMFWRRPHALIELTPTLQQLLARSDLGNDISVALLSPPMPACFIRFGEEMQHGALMPHLDGFAFRRIDGVYVFQTTFAGERGLALVAIYNVDNHLGLGISGITVVIRDEGELLVHVIDRISTKMNPEHRAHHQALAQMCTKVFLYWNVEQARRVVETPYSNAIQQLKQLGPKKAAKLRRRMDSLYDRILLGPLALPEFSFAPHGEVSPHWRRGHFRMQPHGPHQSLRKVIFIAPTLVRADRLDAK
ncbi:MAG: hypothetical protein WKG03_08775 [Telluria sp.]